MKQVNLIVGLSVVGLLSLACSSDSTPSTSGVQGTTALSAVGPTEAATICDWYVEQMSDSVFLDSLCQRFAVEIAVSDEVNAASDTATQTACTNAKVTCAAKMQTKLMDARQGCIDSLERMTCSVKVSDFENCARAQAQQTLGSFPTCDELTADYAAPNHPSEDKPPAECNTVRSLCDKTRY